jgi:hypothetical protein
MEEDGFGRQEARCEIEGSFVSISRVKENQKEQHLSRHLYKELCVK